MRRWLLFLFLVINYTCLPAQAILKKDSAYVELRSFSNIELEELKKNRDFQYNRSHEPPQSLWDKFWNWVWWKIREILSTEGGRTTVWSILIILGIVVMVFFIAKITGMEQGGLFARGSKGHQQYTLSQYDIHHISFYDEIEKAISAGNYRLATRLHYLQLLKKLSDKGYIDWKINKTNIDYVTETSGKSFNDIFSRLTFNFEFTWYGEKQLSKEQFLQIQSEFQQFNNLV